MAAPSDRNAQQTSRRYRTNPPSTKSVLHARFASHMNELVTLCVRSLLHARHSNEPEFATSQGRGEGGGGGSGGGGGGGGSSIGVGRGGGGMVVSVEYRTSG